MSGYPAVMQVYRAKDGWRWRLVARNGNIIADGGEAYSDASNARRAARRLAVTGIVWDRPDGTREVLR